MGFQASEKRGQGWWKRIRGVVRQLGNKKPEFTLLGRLGFIFPSPAHLSLSACPFKQEICVMSGVQAEDVGETKSMPVLKSSSSGF